MARRPERNFFEQIKRNLLKVGRPHDLQRVENVACLGYPDVNYCIAGVEGHLELKAWERVRFSGRFTVPKLREEQTAWLNKRGRAGGRAYLLGRVNKDAVLIDGRLTPALFDRTLQLDWVEAHRAVEWFHHPIDWTALADRLMDPPASPLQIDMRLAFFKLRSVRSLEDL